MMSTLAGTDVTSYIDSAMTVAEVDLPALLQQHRIGVLSEGEVVHCGEQSKVAQLWSMGQLVYCTTVRPTIVELDNEYFGYAEWSNQEGITGLASGIGQHLGGALNYGQSLLAGFGFGGGSSGAADAVSADSVDASVADVTAPAVPGAEAAGAELAAAAEGAAADAVLADSADVPVTGVVAPVVPEAAATTAAEAVPSEKDIEQVAKEPAEKRLLCKECESELGSGPFCDNCGSKTDVYATHGLEGRAF
eukprot:TRINITY_DN39125_c0_g1_i1.p1 TRINITY_DN39125_c0_g1~~TRINITY_DN39125_c0_g1_i1.p1  ORF type:complete len:249 (-),score=49.80 TRINITY_DN39125_c0_g1_i1:3-749(-)